MFGFDWPLVTLASIYAWWVETVRDWFAQISVTEHEWIQSRTTNKYMHWSHVDRSPESRRTLVESSWRSSNEPSSVLKK